MFHTSNKVLNIASAPQLNYIEIRFLVEENLTCATLYGIAQRIAEARAKTQYSASLVYYLKRVCDKQVETAPA